MTYRGHVKVGQITLDEPIALPEEAEVNIEVVENGEPATNDLGETTCSRGNGGRARRLG